jgi:RNA polymerase sigma-32 factor
MTKSIALPVVVDAGLSRYLAEIQKFPMLDEKEEFMLAKRWQEHEDLEAAQKLITSHLRLVAKIAMGFRGYGLPASELISEGNIGLMHAVKRFDPDKGFRLATYAMWWIKASIQEYVLRSWSLVKMGTTAAQKKLFFNLRRMRSRIAATITGDLAPHEVKAIAAELDVPEQDVVDMDRRLNGKDQSLHATVPGDSEDEWISFLQDETANHEADLAEKEDMDQKRAMFTQALTLLNERELDILQERRMKESPATLEDLSQKYGISRERVRQIENRAFEKLQQAVSENASA